MKGSDGRLNPVFDLVGRRVELRGCEFSFFRVDSLKYLQIQGIDDFEAERISWRHQRSDRVNGDSGSLAVVFGKSAIGKDEAAEGWFDFAIGGGCFQVGEGEAE